MIIYRIEFPGGEPWEACYSCATGVLAELATPDGEPNTVTIAARVDAAAVCDQCYGRG